MEKLLIFIKHHLTFIWRIIESVNSVFFYLLHYAVLQKVMTEVLSARSEGPFLYRQLQREDAGLLFELIRAQKKSDLDYFKPHKFDLRSIQKQFENRSFLMMGAFENERLIGYFFLRLFVTKRCFVGRIIDSEYRGRGVGVIMNTIMYETAWKLDFRCLSTISRNNKSVIKAHARNEYVKVIKELQNDYLLVEFIKHNPIAQDTSRLRVTG